MNKRMRKKWLKRHDENIGKESKEFYRGYVYWFLKTEPKTSIMIHNIRCLSAQIVAENK